MDLTELAGKLYDAKRREDAAKKDRIEIENEIANQVSTPENGSRTVDAGDGIKITVKRAIGYKADVDAIRSLDVPNAPLTHVPAAWAFDPKAYEKLEKDDPATFQKLVAFVETTPRKPSVTIKLA